MSTDLTPGRRPPPIFRFGFRPFFLFGALYAAVLVPVWAVMYSTGRLPASVGNPMQWHGHEMLFGFAGAIIAGFLLTAPAHWTGRSMPRGRWLALLFIHWAAGRVLAGGAGLVPAWVYFVVDVSFLPVVAGVVAWTVASVRQTRNYTSPILLLLMAGANALSHAGMRAPNGAALGTEGMLYLVVVMIAVFAGRIFPFFVRSRFPAAAPAGSRPLEWASLIALVVFMVADLWAAPAAAVTGLAIIAAVLHAGRWVGWHTRAIWTEPMLWVLFVGYAWLPAGLLLEAAATVGWINPLLVRHAFAVGCVGIIILGMICRVSLGHTGRAIRAGPATVTAFVCLLGAALVRVGLPIVLPRAYVGSLHGSAALWTAAFGLYVLCYGPLLLRPRADGQPG